MTVVVSINALFFADAAKGMRWKPVDIRARQTPDVRSLYGPASNNMPSSGLDIDTFDINSASLPAPDNMGQYRSFLVPAQEVEYRIRCTPREWYRAINGDDMTLDLNIIVRGTITYRAPFPQWSRDWMHDELPDLIYECSKDFNHFPPLGPWWGPQLTTEGVKPASGIAAAAAAMRKRQPIKKEPEAPVVNIQPWQVTATAQALRYAGMDIALTADSMQYVKELFNVDQEFIKKDGDARDQGAGD